MNTNDIVTALNNISNKLDKPLFDANTLITVLVGLLSITLGWYITYRLSLKQMKKSLVSDLQIKSSQDIIYQIYILKNSLLRTNSNLSDFIFFLQQYKCSFNELGLRNVNRSDSVYSTYESVLNIHIKLVMDKFEEIRLTFQELTNSFNLFWTIFESKQVILNEFVPIYQLLLSKLNEYFISYLKITSIYQVELFSDINLKNQINNVVLENIQEKIRNLESLYYECSSYLGDFSNELQNKYLSHLFNNYVIPKREPKDKRKKVLSLDNYEEFEP
ncbi:hypothetical protein [Ruminiclostridium cellobioparum]|uniref:Uncharacterized protein n=1 Tax=Ruminiclostridium cellobioparum subsp. termitidis CT1112 TaxID=1195236 RepID=S0FY26_RUMCE|nr:hypothetical protein [Ruminiclostridium cellobioparum]EMS74019.1 hypothetical protein CTER_5121 [Ruminiclostridium cellobioparum subsp. termitidis CT1112]